MIVWLPATTRHLPLVSRTCADRFDYKAQTRLASDATQWAKRLQEVFDEAGLDQVSALFWKQSAVVWPVTVGIRRPCLGYLKQNSPFGIIETLKASLF